MDLTPGSRWRSAVCDTEVVVVRAPVEVVTLECGGAAMVPIDVATPPGAALDPALAEGTQIGKRYVDEERGIEVLATKAGNGTLGVDGTSLSLKGAKPLPASD